MMPVAQSVNGCLLYVAALYHLDNRQVELLGKFPVTGIVSRNRHDSAGTIGNQNIVGNENRNFFAGQWIDSGNALQTDAGLILGNLGTLKVGLAGQPPV